MNKVTKDTLRTLLPPEPKKRGRPRKDRNDRRRENWPHEGRSWLIFKMWWDRVNAKLRNGVKVRQARKQATDAAVAEYKLSRRRIQEILKDARAYAIEGNGWLAKQAQEAPLREKRALLEAEIDNVLTVKYGVQRLQSTFQLREAFKRAHAARIAAEKRLSEIEPAYRKLIQQQNADCAFPAYHNSTRRK